MKQAGNRQKNDSPLIIPGQRAILANMTSKEKTITVMVRGVPPHVHREFKATCALQGKTLSGALREYMEAEAEARMILEQRRTVAHEQRQ